MWTVLVVTAMALVAAFGSVYLTGKNDNVVEEISESVIEQQWHLPKNTIDLTPGSPEVLDFPD